MTVTLAVEGMTCGGCVSSVERVLAALPGVGSVSARLTPSGEVTVTAAAGQVVERAALVAAISSAGFSVPSR